MVKRVDVSLAGFDTVRKSWRSVRPKKERGPEEAKKRR